MASWLSVLKSWKEPWSSQWLPWGSRWGYWKCNKSDYQNQKKKVDHLSLGQMAGITGPFGVFRSSKNENETELAAGTSRTWSAWARMTKRFTNHTRQEQMPAVIYLQRESGHENPRSTAWHQGHPFLSFLKLELLRWDFFFKLKKKKPCMLCAIAALKTSNWKRG